VPLGCGSDPLKDVARHTARELAFADEHFAGIFFVKERGLLVVVRAHDGLAGLLTAIGFNRD